MLFNTVEFALFLPLVLLIFFLLPGNKQRLGFLVVASYYFYMCWRWEYLLLILAQTEINYVGALGIQRAATRRGRKFWLVAGLASTLAILFFFKYFNFAAGSVGAIASAFGGHWKPARLDFLLPIGISFHTFQTLGYLVDVYRGRVPPEKNFVKFALFVSFFPLLVAGPIERAGNLLPQFEVHQRLRYDNVAAGLRLILWGVIKKMVIADRVGTVVSTVYGDPRAFPGQLLILATFLFAVQIYCDFSGYSDIAIGAARIFGYQLMTNFRMPYFSTSLAEFWQRWHISLSTWFRDYLYIPLGGNRVSTPRWVVNILLVFTLSGLWHGANWTFVIWGAIHGAGLAFERLVMVPFGTRLARLGLNPEGGILRALRWLVVFGVVLCAWVFFKASTAAQAFSILRGFFDWHGFTTGQVMGLGLPAFELGLAACSVVALVLVDAALFWQPAFVQRLWAQRPVRWSLYLAGFYSIVFFAVYGRVEFIYFQF
jgi:D-alanyl-lipoteichoic acid acyltransferase DltB (MBOAT superfamily)